MLASNLGSLPEIVEDGVNGRLFKAGDARDLEGALTAMAGDRTRLVEMGNAARRFYEEKYTEEAHISALERIFRDVVPGYRSSVPLVTSSVKK